jgi:hypothetical protein
MKNLQVGVQGVKGGNVKQQKVGYAAIFVGSDKIVSVDNYNGTGDNYIQREQPIISIFGEDSHDCIFEGTHTQLVDLLNKYKEMLNQLKVK